MPAPRVSATSAGAFTPPPGSNMYSQQQRMIMEAFRAEEYIKDRMDVQSEPLYDTNTSTTTDAAGGVIQEGQPSSQFFTNIVGKPLNLTNMKKANELMNPEAQAVMAYRYYLDPRNSVLDSENVMASFALRFTMGSKPYQTVPLWMIPQGGGLFTSGCCGDACVVTNGEPKKDAIRTLGVTLILEQGVWFEGALIGGPYTVTSNFIHQLNLDGLHARGIQ